MPRFCDPCLRALPARLFPMPWSPASLRWRRGCAKYVGERVPRTGLHHELAGVRKPGDAPGGPCAAAWTGPLPRRYPVAGVASRRIPAEPVRARSEEQTSDLQTLLRISLAVL